MTTPGNSYGIDQELLSRIAKDVRDWDAAYTDGAKIERVLKRIETHLDSTEAHLKKIAQPESYDSSQRRIRDVLELQLLAAHGYDIDDAVKSIAKRQNVQESTD